MRTLVTGASGFIGGYLVRNLLARGYDVSVFVRRSSRLESLPQDDIRLVSGDIQDPDDLRKAVGDVDVVFHLAGLTKSLRNAHFYEVNGRGTENLAAACARCDSPPTLVLVSSLAAAGPSPPDRLRTELDPYAPISEYGRSKLMGERAAGKLAGRMPITIVRPPIVFGAGDSNLGEFSRLMRRLRMHIVPGFTDRRFSMIHAIDLVEGICLAAENGRRLRPDPESDEQHEGCYFLADDEHPRYCDIGPMIGKAIKFEPIRVVRLPEWIIWAAAGASELASRVKGQASLINFDKIREATGGSWACSPERAKTELGFCVGAPLLERFKETSGAYLPNLAKWQAMQERSSRRVERRKATHPLAVSVSIPG